jgi:ankyrin repeat protein
VSLLVENGALVTATDHHSATPLHLACQKGHQKTVVRNKKNSKVYRQIFVLVPECKVHDIV